MSSPQTDDERASANGQLEDLYQREKGNYDRSVDATLKARGQATDMMVATPQQRESAGNAVSKALYGHPVDFSSTKSWVRSLGAEGNQDKNANKVARGVQNLVTNVERSKLGKLPWIATRAVANALLPDMTPGSSSGEFSNPVTGVNASLYGELQDAWNQGELERAKELPADQRTPEQRAAVAADARPWQQKGLQAIKQTTTSLATEPGATGRSLIGDLGRPSNLALMAATGGTGETADLVRMGTGITPTIAERAAGKLAAVGKFGLEAGITGAAQEAAATGNVTAAGIASQLPMGAAVAGMRRLSSKLAPKPPQAAGESAPHLAEPAPMQAERPMAATETVTPEPVAPMTEPVAQAPEPPAAAATPVTAAPPAKFAMPPELSKASPRFGKQQIKFEDDLDRALYTIGSKKVLSAADKKFLDAVTQHLGIDEAQARGLGQVVKNTIKGLASGATEGEPIQVPSHGFAPVKRAEPAVPALAPASAAEPEPVAPEPVAPIPAKLPEANAPAAPAPMEPQQAQRAIESARRDARHYAGAGHLDAAHEVLDDARDAFMARYGEKGEAFLEREKQIAADHAAERTKGKAATIPPKPAPRTVEEAHQQVAQAGEAADAAARAGDVETAHAELDAVRKAADVVAPVGDEGAKLIDEAKQMATETATQASQPTPRAPTSAMERIQAKVEAGRPTGDLTKDRPTAEVGGNTYKFASMADHGDDPVNAWMHDVNQLTKIGLDANPGAGYDVRHKALVDGGMDPVDAGKLKNDLRDIASAAAEELPNGRTAGDVVSEGMATLTGEGPEQFQAFLQENDLTPDQFLGRMTQVMPSNKTQARIMAARDALTMGAQEARRKWLAGGMGAMAVAGAAGHLLGHHEAAAAVEAAIPAMGTGSFVDLAQKAGHAAAMFERRGDRADRIVVILERAGKTEKAKALQGLTQEVRRIVSATDDRINNLNIRVAQAAAAVPTTERKQIDLIPDVLEGKKDPSVLTPATRALYDAVRSVFDELGAEASRVLGITPRKNWIPRLERKDMFLKAVGQVKDMPLGDYLDGNGQVTVAGAKRIPDVTGPLAQSFVDNVSKTLASGLEIGENGKLKLVVDKEDGVPVLRREAGYLWNLTDDDGQPMPPFMPEVFKASPVEREVNGKTETVWEPELRTDREWTKEDLDALLRGEAIRLLSKRENYDPDAPRETSKIGRAQKAGRWQTDGSLTNARLMPYAGDEFYNRNILDLVAHVVPRQVRGLARIEAFGKDRSGILEPLTKLRGALSDAELGLVTDREGKSRLATFSDGDLTTGPYRNSLLRDYEDALMGYARPFTQESGLQRVAQVGGEVASLLALFAKNHPALNDLIDQVTRAYALEPRFGNEFVKQRLKLAPAMMQRGLGQAAMVAAEGARATKLAAKLRAADPIWQYQSAGFADALRSLGGSPGDRLLNGTRAVVGGFVNGSIAGDVAARMAGVNTFAELVNELRAEGIAPRADDGPLTEALYRTTPVEKVKQAMSLLDDRGQPVSQKAARELVELSQPFAEEVAAWVNGSSNPLFQPRFTRSRNAKLASWLQLVPISLAAATEASIQRAVMRGAYGQAVRQGGKLLASSAATGAAKVGLWATAPAAALLGTAILSGSVVPMLGAYLGAGAKYEPDNENAKATWEVLRNSKGLDWARAAAATTMQGVPWTPKFAEVPALTQQQASLAGRRQFNAPLAQDVGAIALPGVAALAGQVTQGTAGLGLALKTAPHNPVDALRVAVATTIAPQVKEAMGKEYRSRLEKAKSDVNLKSKLAPVMEMQKGYAPELMRQKIMNKVDQLQYTGDAADYSTP